MRQKQQHCNSHAVLYINRVVVLRIFRRCEDNKVLYYELGLNHKYQELLVELYVLAFNVVLQDRVYEDVERVEEHNGEEGEENVKQDDKVLFVRDE